MSEVWSFEPIASPSSGATGSNLTASATVTGSTTAASVALPGNQSGDWRRQIQIANTTTAWAFVNFGASISTVTAATVATGFPVAPGAAVVVTVAPDVAAASVILGTAPGTLTSVIFTRGVGL